MRECTSEQHKHPPEQEDKEAADSLVVGRSVYNKANGIVPADVDEDSRQSIPPGFDENIGKDKSCGLYMVSAVTNDGKRWLAKAYCSICKSLRAAHALRTEHVGARTWA